MKVRMDMNNVRKIIRIAEITSVPDSDGIFKGIINLHGGVIAVMDLSRKLDLP